MAKNKQKPGTFKKGNPGGPGRPQLPPDIKGARVLNQIELERMLNDLIYKPVSELRAIRKNPASSAIETITAKVVIEANVHGDLNRFEFLLNRLVGKVKDKLEVSEESPLAKRMAEARKRSENKKGKTE